MIKAIVFDIGGVLYDENNFKELYLKICRKFDINPGDFFKIRKKYHKSATLGNLSANKYPALIAKDLGIKDIKEFIEFWFATRKKLVNINKNVQKTISKLSKNYILGTLTNVIKTDNNLRNKLRVYNYFKVKLISNKEGLRKPDIKFYKLLIKRTNLSPEQIVFIDDEKGYLIPAKKLGMKIILFKNNSQLVRELKKLGVKI